jgi:GNAT superfamily N-acetyltransferase
MSVDIRPVGNRGELRKFIFLPEKIHRNHAKWMPPIYMDEWRYFDPKRNRSFTYCDTVLTLAWDAGKPVGRIMGIINRRHNESSGEKTARFGFFECPDDQAMAHALLNYVEDWARKAGMARLVGPMGFTDQDPEGFLFEGLDEEPTLATYYNFGFMNRLMETAGYVKDIDYVVYRMEVPKQVPPVYERVYQRIARCADYQLREFTKNSQLKNYVKPILGLMNETFSHLYGYVALDDQEMNDLAKQYIPMLDPRFVKVVECRGEVVAFVIGMPNMNDGIRRARGRLFPFGIFMIMSSAKHAKQLDLLLGGIRQEHRGKGLDVVMGRAMLKSAIDAGLEVMDSHHEMETNLAVRAEMERVGGQVYKRQRVYQKVL